MGGGMAVRGVDSGAGARCAFARPRDQLDGRGGMRGGSLTVHLERVHGAGGGQSGAVSSRRAVDRPWHACGRALKIGQKGASDARIDGAAVQQRPCVRGILATHSTPAARRNQ